MALLIEQQIEQFHSLDEWFKTPLGASVAAEFKKQLEPVLNYLKGESLLQLGHCGSNLWLDQLLFQHKWIASPQIAKDISLACSLNQIPLQRNSLDCVVSPLVMEPFSSPLFILDEIDRILKPMGYLIIFCFNPWSLWGGALKSGLLDCYAKKPLTMYTSFYLNRILMQRGYVQRSLSHFYYLPPVKKSSTLKKMYFLNEMGKMLWPFPSGFYCYIAQKYTPITPSFIMEPVLNRFVSALPATNYL